MFANEKIITNDSIKEQTKSKIIHMNEHSNIRCLFYITQLSVLAQYTPLSIPPNDNIVKFILGF
jgi:hypothetical protein